MIIKNKGYEKKFIYGGANILTPLWNIVKKAYDFLSPKAIDFGKKQVLNLVSKGSEAVGKKAVEKAKDKINKLLSSKTKNNKNGITSLVSTDPLKIGLEAPTIDNGLNKGLNRGLGIKII